MEIIASLRPKDCNYTITYTVLNIKSHRNGHEQIFCNYTAFTVYICKYIHAEYRQNYTIHTRAKYKALVYLKWKRKKKNVHTSLLNSQIIRSS